MKNNLESLDLNEHSEENDDSASESSDSVNFNLIKRTKKYIKEKEQEDIKILGKKTERDETNIIFLADKKIFINSFVPDINELNKFLNECTIIEIDKKDINDEIKKINDKKIFDPDEFIQKNYGLGNKNNISIEDLDFLFEKNNKTEKYEENQIIEKSEIQAKEERSINEILQEKNIDKQKKEINQLLNKIKEITKKDININNENKLNIVFDLDNTCVYSLFIHPKYLLELEKRYPENDFKIIKLEYGRQIIYTAFVVRKGLKKFIEETQSFCDFYINTLGANIYGMKIKEILEEIFKIEFKGFKGRKNDSSNNKFLKDLSLEQKNTIIFDDKPIVWIRDNDNVIISKYFIDKKIIIDELKNTKNEKNNPEFLSYLPYFFFHQSSENNWKCQKLKYEKNNPFYDANNKNCYSCEYLENEKNQFIYMKEVIKIIYYLVYNHNIYVPDALKIIRYNIFYNCCFNLNFYKTNNQHKKDKDILKDIIITCGGIIYEQKKYKENNDMKYYIVCAYDEYKLNKEDIKKQKILIGDSKVISDEYVINSFFFMTKLDNTEYYFDINDENDFDNY